MKKARKKVGFRFPVEAIAKLKRIAEARGKSQADVLIEWIKREGVK